MVTEPTETDTKRSAGIACEFVAIDAEFNRAAALDPQSDLRAKVIEVIEIIRPIIQADHGDIVLKHINEADGIVSVELVGACASCPASTQTLKVGVERIIKDRVPGIIQVISVAGEQYEGTPLSL